MAVVYGVRADRCAVLTRTGAKAMAVGVKPFIGVVVDNFLESFQSLFKRLSEMAETAL